MLKALGLLNLYKSFSFFSEILVGWRNELLFRTTTQFLFQDLGLCWTTLHRNERNRVISNNIEKAVHMELVSLNLQLSGFSNIRPDR